MRSRVSAEAESSIPNTSSVAVCRLSLRERAALSRSERRQYHKLSHYANTRRVSMKRIIITSLAVLAIWGGAGVNFAAAQFGTLGQQRTGPFTTQQSSTFPGGGFNTYGILRPPFDSSRTNDPLNMLQRLNADGSLQGLLAAQTNMSQTGLQTG